MPDSTPLLEVESLSKLFRPRRAFGGTRIEVHAVRGVSFHLAERTSLGIVGESGSGKTTIARMLCGLEVPSSGRIQLEGRTLPTRPSRRQRLERGRVMQIVFQDPYTSLDPHQSIRRVLEEVQKVHSDRTKNSRSARTAELLDAVGLSEKEARSLPRELSGGQRQRAALARALATDPKIVILDEAVSALDVSIQAQILNLLTEIRHQLGLAYILISHDLAVVRQVADEVVVMYRGRVVEFGPVERILSTPLHPYTKRLLDSVPRPGMTLARRRAAIETEHEGCLFLDRCPHAHERCTQEPELIASEPGHAGRCWLVPNGAGSLEQRLFGAAGKE